MEERYTAVRGSTRRYRDVKNFLNAWKQAGFPANFKTNEKSQRKIDKDALRDKLWESENPEAARLRRMKSELSYRRQMSKLQNLNR